MAPVFVPNTEFDVATFLGGTYGTPTPVTLTLNANLFPGPERPVDDGAGPTGINVFVQWNSGLPIDDDGAGADVEAKPHVQVLVRGSPRDYLNAEALARELMKKLQAAQTVVVQGASGPDPTLYALALLQAAAPFALPENERGEHRLVFDVELWYEA